MGIRSGDVIGPYTIARSLSNDGGMSQVFLAHDSERPQYKAALKVQKTHKNRAAFQDLLRDEARWLRTLRHPGIVHIYPLRIANRVTYTARAVNQKDSPWYYAMEYIPGESLDVYIKNIVKFPLGWIIELFYQVLLVVDYMHRLGYAHCDLKPQNIMFREAPTPDRVPAPILVDFGSATPTRRGIVQLAASLRYAPREVVLAMERKDIPPSTLIPLPKKIDIWALGAILFEMVTGRALINHHRKKDITTSILRGELDDMRSQRGEVHVSLDKMLLQMLRPIPAERPDTKDLLRAIEERIFTVRPPRVVG